MYDAKDPVVAFSHVLACYESQQLSVICVPFCKCLAVDGTERGEGVTHQCVDEASLAPLSSQSH